MSKALTAKSIESEKPSAKRREIPDGLLVGLYLIVQPSGQRSFAIRYRHGGQPRKLTLGRYPALDLAKARELGAAALRAAAEGRDPASEKQQAKTEHQRRAAEDACRQRDLFENVAREFIERYAKARAAKKGRPDAWKESARILGLKESTDDPAKLVEQGGEFIPYWRGRRIQEIAKRDVIERLEKIADRAPIMANRSLAAIRKLFNWAVGRDILIASPCVGVAAPSPEKSRDRILTDEELYWVWKAAVQDSWPFGPLVQLLILTGQREAEVAAMCLDEIDIDNALWTLPAWRTKNNELHQIPLSALALAIIKAQPVTGSKRFLFSIDGERPVTTFSRAKERIDTAIAKLRGPQAEPMPAWVFHDLRRTMVSGMARLGIELPVIEKCINHKSGTFRGIVGVYQRHSFAQEKEVAFSAWARFVEQVVSGKRSSNVVALKARKPAF
jgi:integrase